MGHLISAGTGMNRYKHLTLDPREQPQSAMEYDEDGMPVEMGSEQEARAGEV
jgi:hypothetical protein